jgi:hypothetical protein
MDVIPRRWHHALALVIWEFYNSFFELNPLVAKEIHREGSDQNATKDEVNGYPAMSTVFRAGFESFD